MARGPITVWIEGDHEPEVRHVDEPSDERIIGLIAELDGSPNVIVEIESQGHGILLVGLDRSHATVGLDSSDGVLQFRRAPSWPRPDHRESPDLG